MPLLDINKPEIIQFLIESYEKTALLRMKWNQLNRDRLNKAATLQREEKGYREIDVYEAIMAAGIPSITRDYKSDARNRRLKPIRDGTHIPGIADLKKGHSIVDTGLGDPKIDSRLARPDTDLTMDPIMRPVDPVQMNILYHGRPTHGRQVYLKKRSYAIPEDRYYFAETSSWDYGWRYKDCSDRLAAPKHGRVWNLTHERSRCGYGPDPKHYKDPRTGC